MTETAFPATLALVGVVIIAAALLSGYVERVRLPQVALFLLLGAALGPYGLQLVDFPLESSVLRSIATIGLVLVLFTDAVAVDLKQVRTHARLVALCLGPGTLVTAAAIAVAAWALLDLTPAFAAILGAALASTDPVMLRGLLRTRAVPPAARQALGLEASLNDLVLLPIVLLAMAALGGVVVRGAWPRIAVQLLVLGPAAGAIVGFLGVALLEGIRKRAGIRRDYESIYALGVAFTAFAAAEALHGSGFLAAFTAGLTVAAFDAELCDCFLDYGEATAEMFLLFTFVAFGTSLIWTGASVPTWRTLAFAAVALLARSAILRVALMGITIDAQSRRLVVWFGPRGLSSLLLVLLPVFAGLPDAQVLFPPAALVVLLSVVFHGGALAFIGGAAPSASASSVPDAAPSVERATAASERITLDEYQALMARGERVHLLDVRTERAWRDDDLQAAGAIRLVPDNVAQRAAELALPRHDWLVAYCA